MISSIPYVSQVTLLFDAFPEKTISATVKEIGQEASVATRTYPITLEFVQPPNFQILPGMAGVTVGGKVSIPKAAYIPTYEIPIAALFSPNDDQSTFVWVINESNHTVSKKPVKKKETTSKGVIVEGLQDNELIVSAGVEYLDEGQKVQIEMKRDF